MKKCRLFIGYKQNECQISTVASIFYNTHFFKHSYRYFSPRLALQPFDL